MSDTPQWIVTVILWLVVAHLLMTILENWRTRE